MNHDISQIVENIEDVVHRNVNTNDYKKIMPRVAHKLFERYCLGGDDMFDDEELIDVSEPMEEVF